MKKLLIAATVATALCMAQAALPSLYQPSVEHRLVTCELIYVMARGEGDGSKFFACIAEGEAELKGLYAIATKAAGKNAALKDAVKEYHIRAIAALRGINPTGSERKFVYEARQGRLREQLDEAWARVEVEQ